MFRNVSLAALLAPAALASSLAIAESTAPRTLNTRFSYKATVPEVPLGAKVVDLWLPIPADGPYQTISNVKVNGAPNHRITTESKYGNRMVYVRYENAMAPLELTVSFDVLRKEAAPLKNGEKNLDGNAKSFLGADGLVPVGGRYAEISAEIGAATAKGGYGKVKAIYEHVVATMQYDYNKESPHLGEGDVAFVCDYKKGNCSDLHSYLISVARSSNVPAYLEYGFPLSGIPVPDSVPATGKIGGYHCWTWFYDETNGWLPVDASDGRRWLDSKREDVKELLVGNLVLERSAVAISRGRDLTLNPPQKDGTLNYFIYPYAEADGKEIAAKWEMSYEVLPQAAVSNADLLQQINELREIVMKQNEEIQQLKSQQGTKLTETVASPPPPVAQGNRPPVTTNAADRVSVYGFARADAIYDSSQMNPNSQFPFFVQSPSNPMVMGTNDQFTLHPRLSRVGINYNAPAHESGWAVRGNVEFDFQGGGSESRPNPRARHLYLALQRGPNTILAGQTWDLISPLFPSPNDDSLMWNAGNLGDRRPQLRYTFDNGEVNFGLALGLTGAIDAKDLDANGVRDGEDSGIPHLQARVGWKGQNGGVGIWGHVGRERTTLPFAGATSFDTNSLGVDFHFRQQQFELLGEVWTGRNLSDFRGGIGQGVTAAGTEVRSSGGWVELGLIANPKHRIAIGYTVDDPRDADIPASGRLKNDAFYIHNKWALTPQVDLGFNYIRWMTRYSGLATGTNNRFNFFISHKF